VKDSDLAQLCYETYVPPCSIMVGDDLACNITQTDTEVIVSFRGTINAAGWARDIDAIPKYNDLLGWCHEGFLNGATTLLQYIEIPAGKRVTMTGHSLGAALASLVFGLRIASKQSADVLVTFGSPRPAYENLATILAALPVREYLRGNDPVPDLPYYTTAFPYRHAREPMLGIGQPQSDSWACHDIRGYIADLKSKGE